MPNLSPLRRRSALLALAALLAVVAPASLALAQEEPSTTTTTVVSLPPVGETTTTTAPGDTAADEDLAEEPVPVVADTVPPRPAGASAYAARAGQIVRQELRVAKVGAARAAVAYAKATRIVTDLRASLDQIELTVAGLAAHDREAIRRVEIARRQFEARAANAVVRGGVNDFSRYVSTDDPNDLAVAETLLDSVLAADQTAVADYLQAKADVDGEFVRLAERLVEGRLELEAARSALVDARRAHVAAQFNLAVFEAGSEIVIHGFTFPVGDPHTFGDSFGAPRMVGTTYQHAHQGTDIMAPFGTPLVAAERGIITKMGSDVLGGTKIWVKGESGAYYYYAHLRGYAAGMVDGLVVDAGTVIGFVGDTGNARGGAPHLHFEIHPDGGPAVNPYPLLKVVDQLARQATPREG